MAIASTSEDLNLLKDATQEVITEQNDADSLECIPRMSVADRLEELNTSNVNNDDMDKDQNENKVNQSDQVENEENVSSTFIEKVVSKSGNWLATKDADGNIYYFHKITRFYRMLYIKF